MSLPNIFIGGDSWGVGELPALEHLGLEQYFQEAGFQVYNAAVRGAGPRDSIGLLLETLKLHYQPDDYIFWIQSDPIRDLRPYTELPEQVDQAGGLRNLMHQLLSQDYDHLHSVGRRFKSKIYLIGGLTSVVETLVQSRPRLNTLVTSWVELLVSNQYPDIDWSTFCIWNSDYTIEHFGSNPSAQVVDELYEFDQNRRVFRHPVFKPDGFHPNREGHLILYNHIREKLKI